MLLTAANHFAKAEQIIYRKVILIPQILSIILNILPMIYQNLVQFTNVIAQ